MSLLKQCQDLDHKLHPKPGDPVPEPIPEQDDIEALADRAGYMPGGVALVLQEFKLSCAE